MNAESESSSTSTGLCVRTASVVTQARSKRGRGTVGQLRRACATHNECVRTVAANVLQAIIAGVGARQAAQREQPRNVAELRIGFAHADELRHLIETSEVTPRRGSVGAAGQGAIAGGA